MVGYTNTGKSTLLNRLTGADTYVKNELFATLDPTARSFEIDGIPFLLVDTVGFLQDLPHHLIEAFKSTLESAVNCDLALLVCDATGEYDMQIETTLNTLKDMGFSSPYLTVMNKSEGINDFSVLPYGSIPISAKENLGMEHLKREILAKFKGEFHACELFIPYAKLSEYNKIKTYVIENATAFTDDGLSVKAVIPSRYLEIANPFIVKPH